MSTLGEIMIKLMKELVYFKMEYHETKTKYIWKKNYLIIIYQGSEAAKNEPERVE